LVELASVNLAEITSKEKAIANVSNGFEFIYPKENIRKTIRAALQLISNKSD
jgi:hypothetical protein